MDVCDISKEVCKVMFSLMVTGYVLQSIMGENGESKAGDVDSGVGLECYK